MDRYERLKWLNSKAYGWQQAAQQEFETLFKEGDTIEWIKSNRLQTGTILRVRQDQALEVLNARTGKEYRIRTHHLLAVFDDPATKEETDE
jgi:aminoglycoside phosphotransferase